MVNFLNSILDEYRTCQALLNSAPPPVSRKRAHQGTNSDLSSRKIHKNAMSELTRETSEIELYVRPDKIELLPAQREHESIFFLNLPIHLTNTVERLKGIYLMRLHPVIKAQSEVEKIVILGEMLLQSMVSQKWGLHLVIAPKQIIPKMAKILTNEVMAEGMHTAWVLSERSIDSTSRLKTLTDIFKSVHWMQKQKKLDPEYFKRFLCLLDLFDPQAIMGYVHAMDLLHADVLRKLCAFATSHLQTIDSYIQFSDEEVHDEIQEAIKKAVKILPTGLNETASTFKQQLDVISKALEEKKPLGEISKLFYAAYHSVKLALRDHAHYLTIVSQIILTAALLRIDPRRFPVQDFSAYPSYEHYSHLLNFTPQQIRAHDSNDQLPQELFMPYKDVILLTTADSLKNFDLATVATAQQPLVSLQIYSEPAECKQMVAVAKQINSQALERYPQAPPPYLAIYCEERDSLLKDYITSRFISLS